MIYDGITCDIDSNLACFQPLLVGLGLEYGIAS